MSASSLFNQSLQDHASAWSCLLGLNGGEGSMLSSASNPQNSKSTSQQSPQLQPRDEAEELLMSEFNKLSIDEQAKAIDDIYSAGSELKENPAMIHRLLTEFEELVEEGNYPIYELALSQDRSYVEDPSFRLKFLRANFHDANKAVDQMIRFLGQKSRYFGADKVARDITLDDLSPNDLKFLLSGAYHIQEETDRHERPIFVVPSVQPPNEIDSAIRALYFILFNILIPNHSVQTKGWVTVAYDSGKPRGNQAANTRSPRLGDMKRYADFATCIPVRCSAFHLCTQREGSTAPLRRAFLQLCLKAMPKSVRERARIHSGSAVEIQNQLSTYGIPQGSFPVDSEGNLREGHNVWFYKHLRESGGISQQLIIDTNDDSSTTDEESSEHSTFAARLSSTMEVVEGGTPVVARDDLEAANLAHIHENAAAPPPYSNQDVLLGRGHDVQNHPGNTAFRAFLKDYQEEYDNSPRLSKRAITKNLTRMLAANGIRFWQKTEGNVWIETNFDEAEKKVGQVFRSARKKLPR